MSTAQNPNAVACPYCGSTDIIRVVPEKKPFDVLLLCNQCQRVVSAAADAPLPPNARNKKAIADQVVELALSNGLIHSIKYYMTEMNKLGGEEVELFQAKKDVEDIIASRGLTNAVKKPNKNGCVIVLIVILLVIASLVYFLTHR
ncbi:hypothetical protein [Chitinophaga vietnamensis]|uniref:hypothetical protein n=1 Tax=Chitinophaga vietnamensis TaxID=2593957 RepID=UPI001177C24F|nr:hypothetical protein [Chitinophaga vietnamensis]